MGFSVDKIAEAVDQTVTDVNKWLNREWVIIKQPHCIPVATGLEVIRDLWDVEE